MLEATRVRPDDAVLDHVLAAVQVLDGLQQFRESHRDAVAPVRRYAVFRDFAAGGQFAEAGMKVAPS